MSSTSEVGPVPPRGCATLATRCAHPRSTRQKGREWGRTCARPRRARYGSVRVAAIDPTELAVASSDTPSIVYSVYALLAVYTRIFLLRTLACSALYLSCAPTYSCCFRASSHPLPPPSLPPPAWIASSTLRYQRTLSRYISSLSLSFQPGRPIDMRESPMFCALFSKYILLNSLHLSSLSLCSSCYKVFDIRRACFCIHFFGAPVFS